MVSVDLENHWKKVAEEIDDAVTLGAQYQSEFRNPYEVYGVLAKEMHEFLTSVSGRKETRDLAYARAQLVGIAAVCVKAIKSTIWSE